MREKRIAGALSLLLLTGIFAFPIDWPVEQGTIANNFGGHNRGNPLLGVAFATDAPVRAAEEGELLFVRNPDMGASRLPSPLGAYVALDHGDGLISIYSRLENSREVPLADRVSKGAVIAAAGQSGWSNLEGCYFSIFDRKERRWINPAMIIPSLEDTRQPNIISVELINPAGESISPGATLRQGRYSLLVNAFDTRLSERENPLAPYRIVCFINGVETAGLNFETISARDGVLMLRRNGLIPTKQIYRAGPAFEVGELWFTRGQANLEIIVQDNAGNARSVSYRIQVE